jgi:hypothetical protein
MSKRASNTGLLHPLSWYVTNYGLPEQTVVNAYRRGWALDDPHKLLESLLQAPGPKSKGLQPLIDYVNGKRGPSMVHRGSSRSSRKPKAESTPATPSDEQGRDPATCRIELTIGGVTFWRTITPAEADKVLALSSQSWLTKVTGFSS